MNLYFLSVAQSQPSPHRTHCPAPASISNGYYLTDRQSETPLALPAVSLGGEQVGVFEVTLNLAYSSIRRRCVCVVERFYDTYIDIEFDLSSFDVWYFDVKSGHFCHPDNTLNSIRRLVFSVIGVYKENFHSIGYWGCKTMKFLLLQ